ncbi:2-oxo-4-hydroxy-4-carboxy-5-ureidoimidazoline decarboxylase [Aestuariibacter halophilus]|uniref:2-oxo-4-hydroxy-4-carboxy-5-ureidoimidazoline decarboxylase n=1 Tax=Fluctibacter halophilus TaxID=226011 RepID=A0ABS8G573_9ALTE|nr:2-oxo-4-hydroxy-4-carboxy-5-ureidoimidazoline decarboxylase [Aestuariibacter halophilus]MCC2615737.1 2-oxo-4-hydroxy-4-carboxy-5-ureidoimidazoline decarboxylase [Aestuariibacter halophilus]
MTLHDINQLSEQACLDFFERCCAATVWCNAMCQHRPYQSETDLHKAAQDAWLALTPKDWLEAFAAHPMIGDLKTLQAKYANTGALASQEQAGTADADQQTLQQLLTLNQQYLKRHGFIFIICATGLSARQMLDALSARIDNDTETETRIAAGEQQKITALRLHKALQQQGADNA